MPITEARAFGVPVVASDVREIWETAPDAIFVNQDINSIVRGIKKAVIRPRRGSFRISASVQFEDSVRLLNEIF